MAGGRTLLPHLTGQPGRAALVRSGAFIPVSLPDKACIRGEHRALDTVGKFRGELPQGRPRGGRRRPAHDDHGDEALAAAVGGLERVVRSVARFADEQLVATDEVRDPAADVKRSR